MGMKSVKLYWNSRTVNSGNVFELLFGERKETIEAAKLLVKKMKEDRHLAMTRREVRFFAKELQTGRKGVRYSYHNFYVKLLRKFLDLGFIEKDVLIWDERRRKTEAVYQLKFQSIPSRPPQGGFVRHCWELARGWNEYVRA
jgi:hypothetical protein